MVLKKWLKSGYDYGEKTTYNDFHKGIDLHAYFEPLTMPFNGTVKEISDSRAGLGAEVILGNKKVRCWHLSQVQAGSYLKNEVFAISGNSGTNTTGPHLHLEYYIDGKLTNPYNLFKNILIKPSSKPIDDLIKSSVTDFFAKADTYVRFNDKERLEVNYWAMMTVTETGPSWSDTLTTKKDVWRINYSWQSLTEGLNRKPQDIIIHEILHELYFENGLGDIHDHGWGVADNDKVLLNLTQNNMLNLVGNNDTKEQYLQDNENILHRIANSETLEKLDEGGLIKKDSVLWLGQSAFAVYKIGHTILFYNDK